MSAVAWLAREVVRKAGNGRKLNAALSNRSQKRDPQTTKRSRGSALAEFAQSALGRSKQICAFCVVSAYQALLAALRRAKPPTPKSAAPMSNKLVGSGIALASIVADHVLLSKVLPAKRVA